MQMRQLVNQSLDLIEEQYARIKSKQEHEINAKVLKQYNESCYLGLLFETTISDYELDVYAHISHTRYKYILIKNEQHLILRKIGQLCGTLQVMGGGIAGNQMNQQASMQINKLTIEKHTHDNEVKNFLR